MSANALLPAASEPPGAVFVGKVSRVNADSTVGVTINAYGDTHEWPPARWVAADQRPTRGDTTLVLIDDAGGVWAFPAVSMPTTHRAGTYAARPAASAALEGVRYFATDKAMEWQSIAGVWVLVSASAPLVTALPASPLDGQRCTLQTAGMAALTPPLQWPLVGASGKWAPDGACVPLLSEVDAYTSLSGPDRSVSSTTYVALAVAGPIAVLPALGWFHIELSFSAYGNTAGQQCAMSYDIGATAAVDTDSASFQPGVSNTDVQRITRSYPKQFAAASTLTAKFRVTGGTCTFRGSKTLKATPVLLG